MLNWEQDPEFKALPAERQLKAYQNYFDNELADDEFLSLPEVEQNRIKTNFLDTETVGYSLDSQNESNIPNRTIGGTITDALISGSKGVIGLGSTAVGLADIATFGHAGKAAKEYLGYDPQLTNEILDSFYSEPQKIANRKVESAEGFIDTAKEMVKNPSTIGHSIIETAPLMLGGAATGRALLEAGVKVAPMIAGAIGEGVMSGGSTAENIRQQTDDGLLTPKQVALSVATGVGTTAFGAAGGRIAKSLEIADIDTLLVKLGSNVNKAGLVKRIVGGGITEGLFEEAPQSAQEQILMNAALDKPLLEGVPKGVAQGIMVGTTMGSLSNVPLRKSPDQALASNDDAALDAALSDIEADQANDPFSDIAERTMDLPIIETPTDPAVWENQYWSDQEQQIKDQRNVKQEIEKKQTQQDINQQSIEDIDQWQNRAVDIPVTQQDGFQKMQDEETYWAGVEQNISDQNKGPSIAQINQARIDNQLSDEDLESREMNQAMAGKSDYLQKLDMMQDEVNTTKTKGVNQEQVNQQGETIPYSSDSPKWMRDLPTYTDSKGKKKVYGRTQLNAVFNNVKSGKKLTENQEVLLGHIERAADNYAGELNEFDAQKQADTLEQKGFEMLGGRKMSATDFSKGDTIVGTIDGVEDEYKVLGTNKKGEVVFKDGVTRRVDMFDNVEVEGIKKVKGDLETLKDESGTGQLTEPTHAMPGGTVMDDATHGEPKPEYPIAPRGEWYGDADYKARGGKIIDITPDEFLSRAKPLEIDAETIENVDILKQHMIDGKTLDPLAIYDNDKTIVSHSDGRHRAIAAKELGIETIPVIDFTKDSLKPEIQDTSEPITPTEGNKKLTGKALLDSKMAEKKAKATNKESLTVEKEPWEMNQSEPESTDITPKNNNLIKFSKEDIDYQRAYNANSGTSFSPGKRAKQHQEDYLSSIKEIHDDLKSQVKPEQYEELTTELERYKKGYINKYNAWLDAKSRTMSSMITGPARFPVASNQKKMDTESKRYSEMVEFSKKAKKSIEKKLGLNKSGIISSDDPEAIQKLKDKLSVLETNHQLMKDANKILRNKKSSDSEKIKSLIGVGIEKKAISDLLTPDFAGRTGYASFSLTNNNATIKNTKDRIKQLEKKAGDKTESFKIGDIEIIDNVESNRVQIVFDGKPSQAIRNKLKMNGFKWSPKNQVWQRQRNTQVVGIAKGIVNGIEPKKPVESKPKAMTLVERREANKPDDISFKTIQKKPRKEITKEEKKSSKDTKQNQEFLVGSEKQIKLAKDIISDIERYTGKAVTETQAPVIIQFGKGATNISSDSKLEVINGYEFAVKNGLESKEQGTLSDGEYDFMERAVKNKEITMDVYNAIYKGAYINIQKQTNKVKAKSQAVGPTKTVYHKASVVGLINLLTDPTNSPFSVSTHDSAHLFWRDVALVLDVPKKNILVENENDIDAHSVTAHDESKVAFDSKEELLNSVKYIIVDDSVLKKIKAGKFNSPDVIDGGLSNKFFEGDHDVAQKEAIRDFYTKNKITTLNDAKNINTDWTGKFLNIGSSDLLKTKDIKSSKEASNQTGVNSRVVEIEKPVESKPKVESPEPYEKVYTIDRKLTGKTLKRQKNTMLEAINDSFKQNQPVTWQTKSGKELSGILTKKNGKYWSVKKENGKSALVNETDIIKTKLSKDTAQYSTSDDIAKKKGVLFQTQSDQSPGTGVTLKDIQKQFTGQEVFISPDKSVSIKFKNGKGTRITSIEHIGGGDIKYAMEMGRMGKGGVILGKTVDTEITLNKNLADKFTLAHEVKHVLDNLGMITSKENLLLQAEFNKGKKAGSLDFNPSTTKDKKLAAEENRANMFAQVLKYREKYRGTALGKMVQTVMDFLDGIVHIGRNSLRKMAKAVESGKVYERKSDAKKPQSVEEHTQFQTTGDYNPEQKDYMKTGGFGVKTKQTLKEKLKEKSYIGGKKLRQGVIDQFDSLKSILNDEEAHMMATLTKSDSGVLMTAINNGVPVWDESGAIDLKPKTKGLKDRFKPLGNEVDRFLAHIAANRSEKLMAEDRENLFTPEQIAAGKTLNQGKMADGRSREEVYNTVRKDFEELGAAITDIAVKTNLINKEEAVRWKEEGFYVPFYRMLEEQEGSGRGPGNLKGLVGQTPYKKLKGGTSQVEDLLTNTLLNWNHLTSAGLRNQAGKKALETAEEIGLATKVPKKLKSKDAVYIRDNGQEVWYDVDGTPEGQLVLDSLNSLNYEGLNTPAMQGMRAFKRILTQGVTASPGFKIRNLTRDSLHAPIVANVSKNPLKNIYVGFKYKQDMKRMGAGGGSFAQEGYIHGNDPQASKNMVGVASGSILNTTGKIKSMWRAWENVGNTLENINRVANFKKDLEDGKTLLEANYNARDQLDFTRSGSFTSVRLLTQVIPFLNARIQGLDKIGRASMDKGQRKQLAQVLGMYTVASVTLALSMLGDDDYDEAPDWEKRTYHMFKVPGVDKMFRIPRPFEAGAIAYMSEEMSKQFVDENSEIKGIGSALKHTFADTFSLSIVPQAFAPALAVYANRDPFRDSPIESQSMQRLSKANRSKPWTSDTAKITSAAMSKVTPETLTLSPVQIQYLVGAYTGWAGNTTLASIDLLIKKINGDITPEKKISEYSWNPASSFLRDSGTRSSKYTTQFYDNMNELNKMWADIQEYRKTPGGKRVTAQQAREIKFGRAFYNKKNKSLSELRKKETAIYENKKMSAAEKRLRIKAIQAKRNKLTKSVITLTKDKF